MQINKHQKQYTLIDLMGRFNSFIFKINQGKHLRVLLSNFETGYNKKFDKNEVFELESFDESQHLGEEMAKRWNVYDQLLEIANKDASERHLSIDELLKSISPNVEPFTVICPYEHDIEGVTEPTCNCSEAKQEQCARDV